MAGPLNAQLRACKFLQANLNGCYKAQRKLLELACDGEHWDLILLQEATRSTDTLSERPYGYELIASSRCRPTPGRHLSTAVYARLLSPLGRPELIPVECDFCEEGTEARELHCEHICTVCYHLPDGTPVYVTNTYNRISDNLSDDCLMSHLAYPGLHFDAGDYNMHHLDWNGFTCKPNLRVLPKTERMLEALRASHMRQLTAPDAKPTYNRGDTFSVIDLTFASEGIECSTPRPRTDLERPKSDHTLLETICYFPTLPFLVTVPDWKKADIQNLQVDLVTYITSVWHLPLDTEDLIGRRTVEFICTLQELYKRHVPFKDRTFRQLFRTSTPLTRLLKSKVQTASRDAIAARDESQQWWISMGRHPDAKNAIFTPYYRRQEEWRQLGEQLDSLEDTEFKKSWRSSYAREILDKFHRAKWAKQKRQPRVPSDVPTLVERDQHGIVTARAISGHDKSLLFMKNWGSLRLAVAPPLRRALPFTPIAIDSYSSPPVLTVRRLTKIWDKICARKAPGLDGITPKFLITFKKELIPYLATLWTAWLRLRRFPYPHKTGRTIPIPKPLKSGVTRDSPNDFRPVCLLSSLGKPLETYIADILAEMASEHDMLPPTQMAARGRSTGAALLFLVEIIQTARQYGLAVSIMCLDQKGAFNRVRFAELKRVFQAKGVPAWLIDIIDSYLSDRYTTVRMRGYESEPLPCGGVPQGSPLSSHLFAFFTSGLLEVTHTTTAEDGCVFKLAFSDDTYVIVVGHTLSQNKRTLARQFVLCEEWASRSGATFNPAKTEMIHFASGAQNDALPMSHYVPAFEGAKELDHSKTGKDDHMKILGVYFAVDKLGNLTWDRHWNHLEKRFKDLLSDCSRIVQSTHGLDVTSSIQVYKACYRSSILSGNLAWLQPPKNPWFLQTPSDTNFFTPGSYESPKSEKHDDYLSKDEPISCFAPDDQLAKEFGRLDYFEDQFMLTILGAEPRSHRWYRRIDLHLEPLSLFAFRMNVNARANMMGTKVWGTILEARNQVHRFANDTMPEGRPLRQGHVPHRTFTSPTQVLETFAAEWKQAATTNIQQTSVPIAGHKRDRATFEGVSPAEAEVGTDDCITEAAANAIGDFHNLHGTDQGDDAIVPEKAAGLQRLKRRIKANSINFVDNIMHAHHSCWQADKLASFTTTYPTRPIPAILLSRWGRHNLDLYRGLIRPVDVMLFSLRTEFIGLRQHQRENFGKVHPSYHCRKCGQNYLETVTHLLRHCPALREQRDAMYRRIMADVPSVTTLRQACDVALHQVTYHVAMFALEHFPNEKFDWTRRNMLELLLECQRAKVDSGACQPRRV